jgi:hypothetical protein
MTPDFAKISKENFETLAAIQKQVLDALAKGNKDCIDCANQEAKLTSTLAQKVTTAKSVPEGGGSLPGVGEPTNRAAFQPSKKNYRRDPGFYQGLRTHCELQQKRLAARYVSARFRQLSTIALVRWSRYEFPTSRRYWSIAMDSFGET